MESVAYHMTLLIFILNQIESIHIPCGSWSPMNRSTETDTRLKNHGYWTKGIIGRATRNFPIPGGSKLGLATYKIHSNSDDTQIFTYFNGPNLLIIDKKVCLWIHYFKIDNTRYIFKILDHVALHHMNCTSNYASHTILEIPENFSFALIYESPDHDIYIYQTCDKSYAWVQIEFNAFKRSSQYWSPFYDPLEAFMGRIQTLLLGLGLRFVDFTRVPGKNLYFPPNHRFV